MRELITAAFGRPVVVDLAVALEQREGATFTRTVDDELVGYVRLTRSWVDAPDALLDVLVLSPLAVLPRVQRTGIGRSLVAESLAWADEQGEPLVFLEGDPAYYSRLGFEAATPLGFLRPSVRIPEPGFQVALLTSYTPSMTGPLVYCDPFWTHDCVGLRP